MNMPKANRHPRKPEQWPDRRVSTLVGVLTVIVGILITGCGSEERQKTRTAIEPDEDLVQVLTDANFERQVLQSERPVVVHFWADWCPRCLEMKPIISRLASEYSGRVQFGTLDAEANRFTAEKYTVQVLPAILVFQNGKLVQRVEGARTQVEFRLLLERIGDQDDKCNPEIFTEY